MSRLLAVPLAVALSLAVIGWSMLGGVAPRGLMFELGVAGLALALTAAIGWAESADA